MYSFRTQNSRTYFYNQVTILSNNIFDLQYSNCAGCYQFDNQLQIVYAPRYSESKISYSQNVNVNIYQISSRIRDPIADVVYFDIHEHKPEHDFQSEFQTAQNKVILNQFTMFITKPEQYSKRKPKFQMNYYNLLEATICQPQQFNKELTTLLFQCGFTMMYYQIDGGKYCVMNKMLNFTESQTCTVGDNSIQLDQIPGSGVYTVTFLSNDYQKFLNSEQYFNCFLFMQDLNDYLKNLKLSLDLKFEYFNDNIYFENQQNPFQNVIKFNQEFKVADAYQQRDYGRIINAIVCISVVIIALIFTNE
ncbi:Conserved_hypothetical protein [Hexamita inflata]|uniref:Transmembrane protein n=1 Tax=Hexamita inflata TaxID=28002 RepID=A0ABP1GWU4_9EUKA